jgi:hypothetical protein
MLLHPEILSATAAERDRTRRAAHPAPPRRRRPKTRARRPPGRGGAAVDAIRAALQTALLGRGRTGGLR